MTVLPAFQGYYVPGQATLLRVLLENEGPDLVGEVQVGAYLGGAEARYVVPLSLPRHSRKEVPIVVGPLDRLSPARLRVRFVTAAGLQAEVGVPMRPLSEEEFVVGLRVSDPAPLSFLSGVKSSTTVLTLTDDDLAEQVWPLHNLDLLVLAGVDLAGLSSGQRRALSQWVAGGGHLVVSGGPQAELTLAGLPEGLLPISLEGETTVEALPALEDFVGESIPPTGPYLVSRVSAPGEAVALAEGDLPLVVVQRQGLGRVTFLALDPTLAPLRSWAGNEALWGALLHADPQPSFWRRHALAEAQPVVSALAQMARLRLPSMLGVGALLLVYIVLVGPVNYLILRRRRRLELAWVTIPLLTVLFALGVYALGRATRGGDRSLSNFAIVRMASESPVALVDTYAGLFSPSKRSYAISAGPGALLGPLSSSSPGAQEIEMLGVEGARLRDFRVEQWSMRTFSAQSVLDPAPDIRARVRRDGNRVSGTFFNGTDRDLQDCRLMTRNRSASLGSIAAGQALSRTVTLHTVSGGYMPYYPGTAQPVDAALGALLGYGPQPSMPFSLAMVCWAEEGSLRLDLDAAAVKRQARTVYLVAPEERGRPLLLPPGEAPSADFPIVPPWDVVYSSGNLLTCEGGFLYGEWEAVLEYRLPFTDSLEQVSGVVLTLEGAGWDPLPEVSFYRWGEDWITIPPSPPGTITVPDTLVAKLVEPQEGLIRVRLVSQSSSGSCLYPVLEIWREP